MTLLRLVPGFAAGVIVAACVVQSQPPAGPTTPAPYNRADQTVAAEQVIPDGQYSCRIDDYRPFLCQVYTNPDGSQTLEKMAGSQRFRGVVSPSDNGFYFDGVFFCPYGDCTQDVQARFASHDDGGFSGVLSSNTGPVHVTLVFMPGGMGYGGVGYGYGGSGYGYAGFRSGSGAIRRP